MTDDRRWSRPHPISTTLVTWVQETESRCRGSSISHPPWRWRRITNSVLLLLNFIISILLLVVTVRPEGSLWRECRPARVAPVSAGHHPLHTLYSSSSSSKGSKECGACSSRRAVNWAPHRVFHRNHRRILPLRVDPYHSQALLLFTMVIFASWNLLESFCIFRIFWN